MNYIRKLYRHFSLLLLGKKFFSNREMSFYFPYNKELANAIAASFIKMEGGSIDRIKLNKLMYLLEKKSLMEHESPIIGGMYISFEFGPAISPVDDDIKYNNWKNISYDETKYEVKLLDENIDTSCLSEWIKELIRDIYDSFGSFSQWELSKYTHDKNKCPEWISTQKGEYNSISIESIVQGNAEDLRALSKNLWLINDN